MKTSIITSFVLGALIGVGISSLFFRADTLALNGKTNNDTIKIGVMTMTTGDLAFLGENIVNSVNLAVEELREEGENIEIIFEDTGNLNEQAKTITALTKLIEIEKVEFIISAITTNAALATADLLDESEVVALYPFTGGENIDLAGEYLLRNGPSDVIAGTLPARDMFEKYSVKRVALITDSADYSLDIARHFKETYQGEVVFDVKIDPEAGDYRTDLTKLNESNPDAILITTANGVSGPLVLKQARELGVTVPVFANFIMENPTLFDVAGDFAEGVYIYTPEYDEAAPEVQDFFKKYEERYGHSPAVAFHTTGTYDAVKMGLEAIREVGYKGSSIKGYLMTTIQNWRGFNGSVSFDEYGGTETGFLLKQVRGGELILVD